MICLHNISKSYNDIQALSQVSIELPDRGLVFLLGKSGSGKTTLLNILGLLDKADTGEYYYYQSPMLNLSEAEESVFRSSCSSFVFQENNLIEDISVKQNLKLALCLGNENSADDRISQVLKQVGLEGFEDRPANSLSAGQKQRAALARALIRDSQVVLADEPTGNLDSENARQIFSLFCEIAKTRLVLLVSHDREAAYSYGDRIIELQDGKIINDTGMPSAKVLVPQLRGIPEKSTGNLPLRERISIIWTNIRKKIRRAVVSAMAMSLILLLLLMTAFVTGYDQERVISDYLWEQKPPRLNIFWLNKYVNPFNEVRTTRVAGGQSFEESTQESFPELRFIRRKYEESIYTEVNGFIEAAGAYVYLWEGDYSLLHLREGTWPAEGEVLISDYMAKVVLRDNSPVNRILSIGNASYRVSGVIETDYIERKIALKKYTGTLSRWEDYELRNWYQILVLPFSSYLKTQEDIPYLRLPAANALFSSNETLYLNSESIFRPLSSLSAETTIIGTKPSGPDEVLISYDMAVMIGIELDQFTPMRFTFLDLSSQRFNGAFENLLNLYEFYPEGMLVTGVYYNDPQEIEASDFYIEDTLWSVVKETYDRYYSYTDTTLLLEASSIRETAEKVCRNAYLIDEPAIEQIYTFYGIIHKHRWLILALSIAVAMIHLLVLIQFIANNVQENRKKIGVLRSMGILRRELNRIIVGEALLLQSIVTIVTIPFGFLLIHFINHSYADQISEHHIEYIYWNSAIALCIIVLFFLLSIRSVYKELHADRETGC